MNILVLKLGALGNVVLSLAAFAAIRQHHPGARITLLTTSPYADWMAGAPWFDRVLIDRRPAWWDLPGMLRLRRMLREGDFDRVYDLQTSSRSSHYFRLFPHGARPEWSGIAPACSHPDRDPERDRIHDIDRQHGQLRQAGIAGIPSPDLSWCRGDIARFALPRPFALLVPGSAPHRPVKRWPAAYYRALATWLIRRGITPVVLGTAGERMLAAEICAGRTDESAIAIAASGRIAAQCAAEAIPPAGAIFPGTVPVTPTACEIFPGTISTTPVASAIFPDVIPATPPGNASVPDTITTTPPGNASVPDTITTIPPGSASVPGAITATPPAGATSPGAITTPPNGIVGTPGAVPRDLTGQTSFGDLADLGRAAAMAVGNDTGPMHLLAAIGCPSLVLFSGDSDPARCAPRSPPGTPRVRVLRRDDLASLTPAEVIAEVTAAMANWAPMEQHPTEQHLAAQAVRPPPARARA